VSPDTPADVSATIRKALAKDPRSRFSTAREFREALASGPRPSRRRRAALYAASLGILAVLAVGAPQLQQWLDSQTHGPEIRSLAVLPLANLSGDPSQQYIADGIHAELINRIAQISAPVRVVSWTTMSRYSDSRKSAGEIARELNVDALVEGTILCDGGKVRITAMLIEAGADQERWSRSYDREMSDVLLMQEEVAREVAREIYGKLSTEQRERAQHARSVDPSAFLVYLEGRRLWNERTPMSMQAALDRYQEAITIDPTFAAAHAGMADAYGALGMQGSLPLDVAHPRAKAAALRALELDESLADAHASLGNILQNYEWDWVQAEVEYRRAIELNPSSSTAHLWLALLLAQRGDADRSVQEAILARELDPASMPATTGVGVCLYFGQRYDEAINSLMAARAVDSTYATLYRVLAGAYLQTSQEKESVRALADYFTVSGDVATAIGLGRLYEAGGLEVATRGLIRGSIEQRNGGHFSAVRIAELYVLLGEYEEALQWLTVGYDERDIDLNRLKVDPMFDPLRSDARFVELLERPLFEMAWGNGNRG
jgi:TolB-like protein/Tfp pilus assembly protein PilF